MLLYIIYKMKIEVVNVKQDEEINFEEIKKTIKKTK